MIYFNECLTPRFEGIITIQPNGEAQIMDERELRTLIEKVNQLEPEGESKMQKVEYMMDFGSVAVMINVSLN